MKSIYDKVSIHVYNYTPFSLELRFISRETVLTDTFIVSEMNFNVNFFGSKTKIV